MENFKRQKNYYGTIAWRNEKFREINSLVKTLLSRKFHESMLSLTFHSS